MSNISIQKLILFIQKIHIPLFKQASMTILFYVSIFKQASYQAAV